MKLKEFLKPTKGKIILFLIFVIVIALIPVGGMGGGNRSDKFYFALPITSIIHTEIKCGIPIAPPNCVPDSYFNIFWPGLIINLIFWYLISCLIIFGYNKVMKK